MGAVVSMQVVLPPEKIKTYLLIDGQQRISTIFLILAAIRDIVRNSENEDLIQLGAEIDENYLINQSEKGQDHYKLLPTRTDRDDFAKVIDKANPYEGGQIVMAYQFFIKKIKHHINDIAKIKNVLTAQFSIVSIVLEADDNPYLVFESLNAKGKPLTQADLIRNYLFMRINEPEQSTAYEQYWLPMQEKLGENLPKFIRHFLMRNGEEIREKNVYYELKERVNEGNAATYLQDFSIFSCYYDNLLNPDKESEPKIRKQLKRLTQIAITTVYPFLMNCYHQFKQGQTDLNAFLEILQIIENYLIRRYICNMPSNRLNNIFLSIIQNLDKDGIYTVEALKNNLQHNYPNDTKFKERFTKWHAYKNDNSKTKFILAALEESFGHKETVSIDSKYTIEHIMPQELNSWWEEHLGEDYKDTHDAYLHNIGNLTLTAYNSELSNADFPKKQERLTNSHLELNKYFGMKTTWRQEDIETRAEALADRALQIWAYFGQDSSNHIANIPTHKKPTLLEIFGQKIPVTKWREVLLTTLNELIKIKEENLGQLAEQCPKLISADKTKFKEARELENGYFVQINLSATSIWQECERALEVLGYNEEDWRVEYK